MAHYKIVVALKCINVLYCSYFSALLFDMLQFCLKKCSQIVAIVEYLGSIYPLCTYSDKKNRYKRKVS